MQPRLSVGEFGPSARRGAQAGRKLPPLAAVNGDYPGAKKVVLDDRPFDGLGRCDRGGACRAALVRVGVGEGAWHIGTSFRKRSARASRRFLVPERTRGTYHPDYRTVLNGMLYLHATGCRWHDLPEHYGPRYTTADSSSSA